MGADEGVEYDPRWAAEQTQRFLDLHERFFREFYFSSRRTAGLEDTLWGLTEWLDGLFPQVLDQWVRPDVPQPTAAIRWQRVWTGERWSPSLAFFDLYLSPSRRALALFLLAAAAQDGAEQATEQAMLKAESGQARPSRLVLENLHPWVQKGARSLWHSGHYQQGVVGALLAVQAQTQDKTGRHDLSETDLFKQTFTTDAPKPWAPRLRLMANNGSKTYASVHRGAWCLAEGLFAGIRNVAAHTAAEAEADEQVALEQLAAVSVLARWVDQAEVVSA